MTFRRLVLTLSIPAVLLTARAEAEMPAFHDFIMTSIDGKPVPLSSYAGKVVLVVNVASRCGYTPQYTGLQSLYDAYKDRGFVVLGFPSNDFMGQEPGTDAEIKTFCATRYHVSFPMFSKISVKGKGMHPLYGFLTDKSRHGDMGGDVAWNFNKFLIGGDGRVLGRFPSDVAPEDEKVKAAVEAALGAGR